MVTAREKNFSDLGFGELVQFYADLRKLMYTEMNDVFPGFSTEPVTLNLAMEADKWSGINHAKSRELWSWVDAFHYYSDKKRFKRFDISIKNSGLLLGLAYGMPTKAKTKLKINVIEATPYAVHKKNTRIFELISESAQIYASLLGADEVRIMRPANNDVANYYCSYGYEYVKPTNKSMPVYCTLKIKG